MGQLPGELGDRYMGPVPVRDLGLPKVKTGGTLGSYFGDQSLNGSNFGGQNKDISSLGALLSDNEKRLATIGVIGIVGWFFLGPKIKKALK